MTLALYTLFGLLIGSFLNVCIYRIPQKLSVTTPARSFCPKCKEQLTWFDNIPVVSWLALGGQCRKCKQPISGQYPLVELLSAAAAALSYIQFGLTPTSIVIYLLSATLIVVSFIDLEHMIIPDVINIPGATIGLCLGIIAEFTDLIGPPLTAGAYDSLLGFVVGGVPFWIMAEAFYRITGQDGLGGGDVKLLLFLGTVLGWKAILPTMFLGSLLGAVVGIAMMIIKRQYRYLPIPFGPFLAVAALLYIFADLPFLRVFTFS